MHLVHQVHTGFWLAHQSVSSFPSSQNFLEKEITLNQRYLPHPNSDSIDFFFEFVYFFAMNLDLLFVSKFSDLPCKLATQFLFFYFFTLISLLRILFTALITFSLIPCRNLSIDHLSLIPCRNFTVDYTDNAM